MIDDPRRQVKTPSCRGCGRIYVDRQWRYQTDMQADDVAVCPACIRAEEERDELLRKAQMRRTVAQIRNGFGFTPGVDVFDGFRDE